MWGLVKAHEQPEGRMEAEVPRLQNWGLGKYRSAELTDWSSAYAMYTDTSVDSQKMMSALFTLVGRGLGLSS